MANPKSVNQRFKSCFVYRSKYIIVVLIFGITACVLYFYVVPIGVFTKLVIRGVHFASFYKSAGGKQPENDWKTILYFGDWFEKMDR